MPRSGSTFSFNVVRELSLRRGSLHQLTTPSVAKLQASAGNAQNAIMKAHDADEETLNLVRNGTMKAICTIRNPEDAIASWMEAFGGDVDILIASLSKWFELYDNIRDHALVVEYQKISQDTVSACAVIARYVYPDVSDSEIKDIVSRHNQKAVFERSHALKRDDPSVRDVVFSYHDRETLYHRRHVSTLDPRPAHERIGAEAVEKIRQAFQGRSIP